MLNITTKTTICHHMLINDAVNVSNKKKKEKKISKRGKFLKKIYKYDFDMIHMKYIPE